MGGEAGHICGIDISKRETIHDRLSHEGLAAYNHRRTEDL